MKKFDTNNPENLSAFLDDELTQIQKEAVEQKLQNSPQLQEKLQELTDTRQVVKGLKPIPSDPYFETRLLERIAHEPDGYRAFLSNRKPAIALATMTIAILIIFRFNPNLLNQMFENNKESLAAFYAKNLRPLLYATNLTNDDIFNFALNKSIPINKTSNQVLSLGNGRGGEEILEVKEAAEAGMQMNVETFARKMGLSAEKKIELNSLLQKYQDKIASAVLVNDNNALAVNPSLWNYHNELRRELLDFVSQNKLDALKKILPPDEITEIQKPVAFDGDSKVNSNYYYYISPDTFFTSALPVDNEKIQRQIEIRKQEQSYKGQVESELNNVHIEMRQLARAYKTDRGSHEIRIFADTNLCRVVIPKAVRPVRVPARLDAMAKRLDSAFSSFKQFTFDDRIPDNGTQTDVDAQLRKYAPATGREHLVRGGSRTSMPGYYNPQSYSSDSFLVQIPGLKNPVKLKGIPPGMVLDSLNKMLRFYLGDSITAQNPDKFSKGMDGFKKEIEQMRKELEKLRKEMQKDKKNKQQNAETEIEI